MLLLLAPSLYAKDLWYRIVKIAKWYDANVPAHAKPPDCAFEDTVH